MGSLLLLPLLLAARAPVAGDPAWTGRYRVRFAADEGGARYAEVEARLAWARGRGSWPTEVELGMADGYPGGYGAFVRGLEAVAPEGSRAPRESPALTRSEGAEDRWHAPVLEEGTLAFRYRVALEHDPAAGLGWDETPHAFSDGVLWTGRALFVTPAELAAEVELVAPNGEHVSTSLGPVEGAPVVHGPVDEHALRETYLLVGRHAEHLLEVEESSVLLALDGAAAPTREARERLQEDVLSLLRAATATAGGPPPLRCLVAITVASGEGGGAVYRHDAHVLAAGPPAEDDPAGWRRVLAHELFHLWNPGRIRFASREMWFSEGFCDYYALRLLMAAGLFSGSGPRAVVEGWASDYLREIETVKVGLREAGVLGAKNRTLIYQGGALAALALDVSLRKASRGKHSLDDVMAELHGLCSRADGGEVEIAELERLLSRLGNPALGGFLERHVEGAEPLALEQVFADAGLRLVRGTAEVPELDAAVKLVGCSGLTVTSGGIRVDRSEAGGFKAEDVIVEVAGQAVGDFGNLRRALAGRGPGDKLPAVVRRRGKLVELELRLGGHGEELPSSSEPFVVLEPDPAAKPGARAIGRALLGVD